MKFILQNIFDVCATLVQLGYLRYLPESQRSTEAVSIVASCIMDGPVIKSETELDLDETKGWNMEENNAVGYAESQSYGAEQRRDGMKMVWIDKTHWRKRKGSIRMEVEGCLERGFTMKYSPLGLALPAARKDVTQWRRCCCFRIYKHSCCLQLKQRDYGLTS